MSWQEEMYADMSAFVSKQLGEEVEVGSFEFDTQWAGYTCTYEEQVINFIYSKGNERPKIYKYTGTFDELLSILGIG